MNPNHLGLRPANLKISELTRLTYRYIHLCVNIYRQIFDTRIPIYIYGNIINNAFLASQSFLWYRLFSYVYCAKHCRYHKLIIVILVNLHEHPFIIWWLRIFKMYSKNYKNHCYIHCKKSFAKFRCGQRWREPNDVGVGKFLLPRRLVLRHRCQHRNLAHSDMAFFTVYIWLNLISGQTRDRDDHPIGRPPTPVHALLLPMRVHRAHTVKKSHVGMRQIPMLTTVAQNQTTRE